MMDCPATVPAQSWSGGGRTCSIASKNVGVSRHTTIVGGFRNEVGINVGSINMRCNDGVWDVNSTSCAPKPCPATSKNWTGTYDSCSQSIGAGTEGQTRTIFDTTFTTGNATYKCIDTNSASDTAEWVLQSVGACYKGCSNTTKSWSGSQTCSDSVGLNGEHNVSTGLSDTSYAASGGGTGSATATCNGTTGNWDLSSTSCILSRDCAGSWDGWSNCTPSCNGVNSTASCPETNEYSRSRNETGIGSSACPLNGAMQNRTDTIACSVDCNQFVSSWSGWSANSASCGWGTQTRTRSWNNTGSNSCSAPSLTDSQSAWAGNCPRNCVGSWSGWSGYSACSGGSKTRTRTYNVTTTAAWGGTACTEANGATDSQSTTSGCGCGSLNFGFGGGCEFSASSGSEGDVENPFGLAGECLAGQDHTWEADGEATCTNGSWVFSNLSCECID
jgi:hypothetical protein